MNRNTNKANKEAELIEQANELQKTSGFNPVKTLEDAEWVLCCWYMEQEINALRRDATLDGKSK